MDRTQKYVFSLLSLLFFLLFLALFVLCGCKMLLLLLIKIAYQFITTNDDGGGVHNNKKYKTYCVLTTHFCSFFSSFFKMIEIKKFIEKRISFSFTKESKLTKRISILRLEMGGVGRTREWVELIKVPVNIKTFFFSCKNQSERRKKKRGVERKSWARLSLYAWAIDIWTPFLFLLLVFVAVCCCCCCYCCWTSFLLKSLVFYYFCFMYLYAPLCNKDYKHSLVACVLFLRYLPW